MKKKIITIGIASVLAVSLVSTSCIGSFALTNKLLSWNKQVGNKFINEVVFFAFWILPVYEISGLADVLVINSIEFWSGSNPMASNSTKTVKGKDGNYLVNCDKSGYTITDENGENPIRLDFDSDTNSWSVNTGDESYKFLTFIDDTHVAVPDIDGKDRIIELSNNGVLAYKQLATQATATALAFK